MAYEIPSQLEYHEKIIFGLTFKQALYATIFGIIDFILFFKLDAPLVIRCSLMIVPTFLAGGFMFFDLDKYLKNLYHWIRFRKSNDIKKFRGIKKIKEYIHTDKKRIAILQVEPINFNIKTKDEKDSITRQFSKFLNAIDFPIQILMRTHEVDIQQFLKKQKTPEQYKELFERNQQFLVQLIQEKKIMDRIFYVIIPEKDHLDIQVQICEHWVVSLGLKCKRLEKGALEKIITITGENLENNQSYFRIGEEYHRIVYAHGYPRIVEQGFLDKIVSSSGDFHFSLHIEPFDVETMMININKQLQKQNADLYSLGLKGIMNPSLEIQYRDTRNVLEELQKGNDKLFNVSLYIDCKEKNLEELNILTRKVESLLNSLLILPKKAYFQMDKGYKSCFPLGEDKLKIQRNVTSRGLSAFFPFTSPFFRTDEKGVWLGLNKNGIPIIRDIFSLSNPNGVILAQSGGGKSYFAKLLISRYLLTNTRVMVIDPQGEYRDLVKEFHGQRIDLSRQSKTIINPLDLMEHDYAEKRLSLMDLMRVMLGELSEPQKAFMDKALSLVYQTKGISEDPETWNNVPPKLEDLLTELTRMEKGATQIEKVSLRSLMNRLSMYVDGVFSFLNRETNIDFENMFVCFDIGDIPKPVKPTIMFLVLDYVYSKMRSDIDRKILLIDESWSLLSRTEDASYIFEIVKTCRKFNMGLLLINQEVEGLLTTPAGKSVLANSAYTVLLKQKPAVIDSIKKVFHLSDFEKDYLLSASVGEGILIIDDEHYELKIVASPEEHKIITTKADELLEQKKEMLVSQQKKNVTITIDLNQNFFVASKLSREEKELLIRNKYKEKIFTSIDGKKRNYLIKPRFNESDQHCLLVYDIYFLLREYISNAWLYTTIKPDLVFEVQGKQYAIEVETGKVHNPTQLREKKELCTKEYGDNWFFVVGDKNLSSYYKRYGVCYDKRNIQGHILSILHL